MSRVEELHRASLADPDAFWGDAARAIDWTVAPQTVLDRSNDPFVRWFPDGELNTAWNCIDRHVAGGRADQLAIVYDSPVTDTIRRVTYRELQDEVARLAGALRGLGVGRGDRVVLYMPMIPEAVFGMLACARLGAVHSVVFGGFAPRELAIRIDDAHPKVILSASCGIEGARVIPYKPLLDQAIGLARHKPDACLVLQRPQAAATMVDGRDRDWAETVAGAAPADCVPVRGDRPALHPLHVGHHRPAEGRRARQRRPRRGASVVDAERVRRPARRRLLGGLRRGLGRRPLLHRLRAAAARLHDDPVRGEAGRDARRGRVLARGRRARRADAVHRADGIPRDQEGGSRRRAARRSTTWAASRRCSSPASAPTPTPTTGRATCSASRSSTTGGRPRRDGRSRRTASASSPCP